MGVSKPSAAFFEQVLSALKIENKSKALVIGDSLNSDILGAQNVCLDACWLAKENATLQIEGRHDPCILHRACVVAESVCAIVIADLLAQRFGTDYLGAEQ